MIYNLVCMNMFLYNVNYDKFYIELGNMFIEFKLYDEKFFDVIVFNLFYFVRWIGSDDFIFINDDCFVLVGVLVFKFKVDFVFVLYVLSYLFSKGRVVFVCFLGIFYWGGVEQKIRKYLVDNNYVEFVIVFVFNFFYGMFIVVNILVLFKYKMDIKIQFIDVIGEEFFKKQINNNVLMDGYIKQIMGMFDIKEEVVYVVIIIDNIKIVENDYNFFVSFYVEFKDIWE